MIPWQELARAAVPGEAAPLVLSQHGRDFVITVGPRTLMGSRAHASEDALAERACARIADRPRAHVVIGGLGMGFTLAAALRKLRPDARVTVGELLAAVVEWNRGPLAHLAGRPLEDPRVTVRVGDVADVILANEATLDGLLLDVDNGPDGLTQGANDWLYSRTGIDAAYRALRDEGVLGVWSVAPDQDFTRRLRRAGFAVEEHEVRAHRGRGGRHTLWLGIRGRG